MRVQAIRAFHDKAAECRRDRGDAFDAPDERAEHLAALGLVKAVEQPKKQPRRTAARKKATTKE